ncbi:MAG TPA: BTAD domain-containing putative transcriptional regulator [Clostridia bacterium]|nr:BTAD domain-containing putative transcriptional regulator [Clostridia bacterium]
MQLQPHHALSVICQEMWALHSQAGYTPTYIVLDDFQNVAQVQDICDMTRYMLDNLPTSCTIFVLNRANLNVFTEKQKLEKRVLEIGADALAFSNAEIEDLMLSMGQTVTNRKQTDIIEKNTEGWIAGIIILCQAVKGKGLYTASIESGKLGHEDALFRYMSLEVLKSIGNDTQDALARLALLQDFSEAEVSEILEINDIKALMGQCMGFGMFIQRIPGATVVYRFHSLFREFLLINLKDRCSDEQIARIHLKAAEYYMRHSAYGRAAEHLTKCGNSATAMDMVPKAGFNKFMIGETGQLKQWLDLLPEDMIMDNPILLLFKAQLMPNNRQPEIVDTLKKVLQLSLQDNNLVIYYDAASVLIYILMCSNNMKGLLEMTDGIPKQLQNVSPKLRNTLAMLDMVRFIGEERFSAAEAQSESILYALLPEDSQWLYLILSCIIYYCMGKLDNAERCLLSSIKAAKAKKGCQVLCGSFFHIAKLYYTVGDRSQGHRYLKQAMELAVGNRYFMFWDIHIPTLVEMALRSIRYGYCTGYVVELLSKFYDSKAVKYLTEKVKTIDENRITAFINDFVSTYKVERSKQLYFVKASLFGKPEISVNGIKIPDTEWKTKKVKSFLEYLLLNSGNTISKEILAEIFWPDSDSKSSIASQRTALYYLRKILTKYNAVVTGNNAFIYETPEGLQIRRNDELELDMHEFLRLYRELYLITGDTSQTEQKQAEILERMISLYKGDLMEGSDYGDLVFHERERLRSIFMEACQKLSSICTKSGKLQQAEEILRRALAAEPYNENVCLELLKLYMSQGRRSKAVKLYYSFKKHLEQELDIKVDKSLTEAIRSPRLEK